MSCVSRYAAIRGRPWAFAAIVTQLVTQPLTSCHATWRRFAPGGQNGRPWVNRMSGSLRRALSLSSRI